MMPLLPVKKQFDVFLQVKEVSKTSRIQLELSFSFWAKKFAQTTKNGFYNPISRPAN